MARREPTEFVEMFGAVKRRITAAASHAYAAADLGTLQAKLLRQIGMHGRSSQAELARATDSHPTLIGRALETLIDRGLVRRERSDEDRREYVLDLTPAGKRARDRVEKLRASFHARIVAALDDRDLDDFDRIARKLLAALEEPTSAG
jgi:DNA-binding MarR family transcriptional regulator